MEERVPSRQEVASAMEEAGFEVTLECTPKNKSIMNPTHYYDARGPVSEVLCISLLDFSLIRRLPCFILSTAH